MASAPREFALDFNTGKISASTSNQIDYTFKKFKSGDGEWFAITLVRETPSLGQGKLTPVSPVGLTLKIAIGQLANGTSGTVYTSVTCTIDGDQFVGKLPMNVSAISDLFASQSADVNAIIEFELTDDGEPKSIDFPVVIRQQIISTDLIDTPAPDVAIGVAEATGKFLPRVMPQGFTWKMIDADTGTECLVYLAGGVLRIDPIT